MSEVIPVALGWKVIVRPSEGHTFSAGGIDLSAARKAQEHLNYIGEIVAMGEAAFTSRTKGGINMSEWENRPEVGDFVIYPQYGGIPIYRVGHGEEPPLRLMNDTDLMAIIDDPDNYFTWIDPG